MHKALDPVMAQYAFPRLAEILKSEDTPSDVWLRAFECAADRLGLPRVTQQDVKLQGSSREVVVVAGGLGWPGVAGATEAPAAGDGDHDDRREQPTVQ